MGVSLAVGIGVVLFILDERQEFINVIGKFNSLAYEDSGLSKTVIKAAGIAVISEMGVQICSDAGESALAGRISLASRITMAGLCCPILERMLELLQIFE
jgi:stage III sporulation protein AD